MPPKKRLTRQQDAQPVDEEVSPKKNSKKKSSGGDMSLMSPKVIGAAVIILVLVVIWQSMPAGNSTASLPPLPPRQPVVQPSLPPVSPAPTPPAVVPNVAAAVPNPMPVAVELVTPTVPVPPPATAAIPGKALDLSFTPPGAQIVGQLKVQKLLAAPLMKPVWNFPVIHQLVDQQEQHFGFLLSDVETITFGVKMPMAVAATKSPQSSGDTGSESAQQVTVVIRTTKDLDPDALPCLVADTAAGAEQISGTWPRTYRVQLPPSPVSSSKPPELKVLAIDLKTYVVGPPESIKYLSEHRDASPLEFSYVPTKDDVVLAVSTSDLAPPQQGESSSRLTGVSEPEFADLLKNVRGTFVGLTMKQGLTLNLGMGGKAGKGSVIKEEFERNKVELQKQVDEMKSEEPVLKENLQGIVKASTIKQDGDSVIHTFEFDPKFFAAVQSHVAPLMMMTMTPQSSGASLNNLMGAFGLKLHGGDFRHIDGKLIASTIAENLPEGVKLFAAAEQCEPAQKSGIQDAVENSLQVDLVLMGEPAQRIVQYRRLTLDEAQTSTTAVLKRNVTSEFPYATSDTWLTAEGVKIKGQGLATAIPLEFANIGNAQKIDSLAGRVEIRTASQIDELDFDLEGPEAWESAALREAGILAIPGSGVYANQIFLMPTSPEVSILDAQLESSEAELQALQPEGAPPIGAVGSRGSGSRSPKGISGNGFRHPGRGPGNGPPRGVVPPNGPPGGIGTPKGPPKGFKPQLGPPGTLNSQPNFDPPPDRQEIQVQQSPSTRLLAQNGGGPKLPPGIVMTPNGPMPDPNYQKTPPAGAPGAAPKGRPPNKPPAGQPAVGPGAGKSPPPSTMPLVDLETTRPMHWSPKGFQLARVNSGRLTVRVARGFTPREVHFAFVDLPVPPAPASADAIKPNWVVASSATLPEGIRAEFANASWDKPDDDSRLRRLMLNVDLVGPSAGNMYVVGGFQLTECTTNDGKKLSLPDTMPKQPGWPNSYSVPRFSRDGVAIPSETFRFEFPLLTSSTLMNSLSSITGSVRVKVDDSVKECTFGDLSHYVGKRLSNEVLTQEKLQLRVEENEGKIEVAVLKKDRDRIAWVELLTAEGLPNPSLTEDVREDKTTDFHVFNPGKTPLDQLGLRIVLHLGGKIKNVQFKFENVPIPPAQN